MRKSLLVGTLAVCLGTSLWAADPSLVPQKDPQPAPEGPLMARGVRAFGIAMRHPNGIALLRYSPDGSYLASAGRRGKLMVWDPATGGLVADVNTQPRPARDLVFSSDSQTVAMAIDRYAVVTFDLSTRTQQKTSSPTFYTSSVAFPPDAEGLISVFGARTAEVGSFRLGEQQPLQHKPMLPSPQPVKTHLTALTGDGRLAACEVGTEFVVFDTETGKQIVAFEEPSRTCRALQFSDDGAMLAAVDRSLVRVWNLADEKKAFDVRTQNVQSVAFAPDGKALVTGSPEGVHLWSVETGGLVENFPLKGTSAVDITQAGDGYQIATAINDRIHIINSETGEASLSGLGHLQPAQQIEFASPPSKLVVSGGSGGQVIVWDRESGKKLKTLTGYSSGSGFALSADGSLLAIAGDKMQLWNTADWTPYRIPQALITTSTVAFDRRGQVLAAGLPTGAVLVWRLGSDEVKTLAPLKQPAAAVALLHFDSTGQRLSAATKGTNVVVWDLPTGHPVHELAWNKNWRNPRFVAEHTLATDNNDHSLNLVDLIHNVEFKSTPSIKRKPAVLAADYTPDGRLAAVAGSDNAIRIREVASGRELWSWRCQNRIYALRWSPDQQQLLAAEADGRLMLWDLPLPESTQPPSLEADARLLDDDKALPAMQAVARLAERGAPAVSLVSADLEPKGLYREDRVTELIRNLDSDVFEIREHAQYALSEMGSPVLLPVREALSKKVSPEARSRLRMLRAALDQPQTPSPGVWRTLRAIAVLEAVGSDDAQQALRRVAAGNPQLVETRAAQAALARLTGDPDGTRAKARFNKALDLGGKAPDFQNLPGVDGKTHSLADYKQAKVVVVIFTCNQCPVSTLYEPRFVKFAADYANRGVQVVAISPSVQAGDRLDKMKERAQKSGFTYPYLWDQSQKSARDYGVYVTPQLFVLDGQRKIAYMGAFDDNLQEPKVEHHYVVDAVKALLAGQQPQVRESRPSGCEFEYEP